MTSSPVELSRNYKMAIVHFQQPLSDRLGLSQPVCSYIRHLDEGHQVIRTLHAQDLQRATESCRSWAKRMVRIPLAGASGVVIVKCLIMFVAPLRYIDLFLSLFVGASLSGAIYQEGVEEVDLEALPFYKKAWDREIVWIQEQAPLLEAAMEGPDAADREQLKGLQDHFNACLALNSKLPLTSD